MKSIVLGTRQTNSAVIAKKKQLGSGNSNTAIKSTRKSLLRGKVVLVLFLFSFSQREDERETKSRKEIAEIIGIDLSQFI